MPTLITFPILCGKKNTHTQKRFRKRKKVEIPSEKVGNANAVRVQCVVTAAQWCWGLEKTFARKKIGRRKKKINSVEIYAIILWC
jgi:hypothetical protein